MLFRSALRTGNIGVLDYYRLENIKADTEMRHKITGEENPQTPEDESR